MTNPPPLTRAQRFAALIHPAAERAGYTGFGSNRRLATDTGMSESSVSRMLKGESIPDIKFFPALSACIDLPVVAMLVVMGIPLSSLQPLSETDPSQVRSRSISLEEAAERLGITDPVGQEMLAATVDRIKRSHEPRPATDDGDAHGGTAAHM
ncbi:hypothetical protein [Streptomyces sp. NPDC058657]|uniref:hypothetical protein n=1 Tax=unclassified Streptomyces TaxID=2593676 RepID=UPI00366848FC